MDAGFGGICIQIPTAIQTPSKLYYLVLYASYRLFDHMKTWAPSPLSLPPNERGGHGNGKTSLPHERLLRVVALRMGPIKPPQSASHRKITYRFGGTAGLRSWTEL